jgi:hypothetical protein
MALRRVVTLVAALLLLTPVAATAQAPATPATPTTPAATSPSTDQLLKPEQLDALVAPIALYPDNLLSLVLMASTYPLEVVQADRWVTEHKNLKGEQLKAEVDKQGWDESVKSLVATPDVLSTMSKKLDWTLKLGDAVLAQQADVMDAIQRLRTKAEANNKLTSTKQQTVTREAGAGQASHRDRADGSPDDLCAVLRSGRCLRCLAISRVSAVLLGLPRIYWRRAYRGRPRIWRRLGSRKLGVGRKLVGRRLQLEQQ